MSFFHSIKSSYDPPSKRSTSIFIKTSALSILNRISRFMTTKPKLPQYLLRHNPQVGTIGVREWSALVTTDRSNPPAEEVVVTEIRHFKALASLEHEALCFRLLVNGEDIWIGADRDMASSFRKTVVESSRKISKSASNLSGDAVRFSTPGGRETPVADVELNYKWVTLDHVWISEGRPLEDLLSSIFRGGASALVGSVFYTTSPKPPTVIDLAHAFTSASLTMGEYDLIDANCYMFCAAIRTILQQPKYMHVGPQNRPNAGTFLSFLLDAERIVETRHKANLIRYHDDMIKIQPGAIALDRQAARLRAEKEAAEARAAQLEAEAAKLEVQKEAERAGRLAAEARVAELERLYMSSSSSGGPSSPGAPIALSSLGKGKGRLSGESTSSRR